ncbi:PSD1 and planctomycete cytochrome C domain-containing protein [Rubritalea profundi]|uniref:Cytochrome c domain-containing protein n=1 Tax=Rubritalea profundi TaxID=1658618 RepID=A0A2S7U463_9BACT|nr:PSD1 and planctomycete cytochrome C domain-containing protein [Rubritalea profundi]PQJ29816.1 hypothetical protein BSZ32_15905 [Rubritalea profundi]
MEYSNLHRSTIPNCITFPNLTILSTIIATSLLQAEAGSKVSFNKDVRPIFINKCTKCHGGAKADGDLSLIYRSEVLGIGKSGKTIIVPGKPAESELYRRIITDDLDDKMPLQQGDHADEPLSKKQTDTIKRWIEQGAQWEEHWAYIPPAQAALPKLSHKDWPLLEMDRYVLASIEKEKLSPSKSAGKAQWLRRVSLDLIGLPPSPKELDNFLADDSSESFEKQVDRLLSSPRFGERWASIWMDLARYADTMGYEKDPHRNIWPYRDYLINSFNADKPYNQFLQEQLAGDLFKNPSSEQLIATAFHRNTQTNTEGGTDDEEYRVLSTIDRVNTTWTAAQGLTFGCIQCHDHPYEPIPHADYYRFSAFFNSTADVDIDNEFPLFKVSDNKEEREKTVLIFNQIRPLQTALNQYGKKWITADTSWAHLNFTTTNTTHGKLASYPDGQLRASGTLAIRTRFDLVAQPQDFTALRVSIIPETENPAELPERASVLSQLILNIVKPDGSKQPIKIAHVFADSIVGPHDPNSSINDKRDGFGGYPKLFNKRQAVFVPTEPVTLAADESLEVTIQHKASTTGSQACTLRRFSIESSQSQEWTKIISNKSFELSKTALAKALQEYKEIKGLNIPIIQQRPEDAHRETRLFIGGLWLNKGEIHTEGVPQLLNPAGKKVTNRLEMAQWISSEKNPLTARVMVNRLFSELFGRGIVQTLGDFGSTGTKPTNLPLLDHLAIEFQTTQKWSIKQALRNMMLSSTYRQDHNASAELAEKDPHNIHLARGPRTRLSAEMIRDNALVTSGLMTTSLGGASVMPPQPDGIWQSVYSGAKWKTSEGANRYRRALYTYWKRTSPYPSMLTFDTPSRDLCSAQRITTNTPLHALITLNDPVFLECSQAFAKRMADEAGTDLEARIKYGYLLSTQQTASSDTVTILKQLHADFLEDFIASPEKSQKVGKSPEDAALTVIANTLLNLDAAITK